MATKSLRPIFQAFMVCFLMIPVWTFSRDAPVTTIGNVAACQGITTPVPFTVTGFTDISAITLRIEYNPQILDYISYANTNPAFTGMMINDVAVSATVRKVIIVWSDITPITLPSGSKLIDLNFTLIAGNSGTVSFNNIANGGQDCEYADENADPMNDSPTSNFYINGTFSGLSVGTTGAITGLANTCVSTTGVQYSIDPVVNATGYTWTVPAGCTIATGQNTLQITVDFPNYPLSGNIEVYASNSCGNSNTSTIPITVNTLPVPGLSGDIEVCRNDANVVYSTEPGMTNYVWNVTGGTVTAGGTPLSNTVTVTWPSSGAGSVSVNYTDAIGCSAIAPTVLNVTVNPLPVPELAGDNHVCLNDAGVVYTTAPGMSNYVWNVTGGTITSGGLSTSNSATVTWNNFGIGTISVSYTNETGCKAATPKVMYVTVEMLPIASISGMAYACAGNSFSNYTTESGMTGYQWEVTGGNIIAGGNTQMASIEWTTAGAQSVGVSYVNGNGCRSNVAVFDVDVYPLPQPTISGDNIVCQGDTEIYTSESGMNFYLWEVTGGTIISGGTYSSNTITVQWNTPGTGTVSVNYTDYYLCSAVSPTVYNVTINPLPVPVISGDNAVCVGDAVVVYTTEAGMSVYTWDVTGGTIITGGTMTSNTATINWNTAGVGTVSVGYTNGNGCTSLNATVYNVTVNTLPIPTLSGDNSVCINESVTYTTESGMTNYSWNVTGGLITAGGTANSNSVTVSWNSAGAGTVSVNYINANGCTAVSSTAHNVTVNPLPVINIWGTDIVCTGDEGLLYATDEGMTDYQWSVTGGTITAGGTATSNTATVTWNSAGVQQVTVSYTNLNGCTGTRSYNVTVNQQSIPTLTGDNAVCVNDAGVVYTTDPGKVLYVWEVTGGTITAGGGAGNNTATVTWNSVGEGLVSVLYINEFYCASQTPTLYPVTVNPLPVPTLNGDNSVYVGQTNAVYSTEAGMTGYVWNVVGGTITSGGTETSNTATITWNTLGTGTISVIYTNVNGCTASTTTEYNVTVNALPVPSLDGDITVCAGESNVTYTTDPGMTGYAWNVTGGTITSGGTSTSNTATVSWSTSGPGTVSVSYLVETGIQSTTSTLNVIINPLPVPVIAGDNAVCAGDQGVVYTTEAGMTGYNWVVTGGTVTSGGTSTSSLVTVNWLSAGSGSISVNYVNANGCTALSPTVYDVTINPLPVPVISGDNAVCVGDAEVVYTTEAGMSVYEWNVTGGMITSGGTATSNSATIIWNTAGAGTVSVGYTNANDCISAAATVYNVTVNPLPVPSVAGDNSVCIGDAGVVYTTEAGMSGYSWNVTGGQITAGGTASSNSVTVTWNSAGAGTVSVNYTNSNSCTAVSPTLLNVTVNPLPVASLAGDNFVCAGESGFVYTTEAGMTDYQWSVTGGIITAGGTSTSNTATITWNTAGAQSVVVSYTNANGCTCVPVTYNVTVNPLPLPTIAGDNSVCIGDAGVVYTTETGMTGYSWNVTGGTITAGGTSTSNTATVTWNSSGVGTVSVNYTNANLCTATTVTVYNVTVNTLPVPTISGDNLVYIGQSGVIFTTQPGMSGYNWNVTGGTITAGGTTASNTVTVTWNTLGAGSVSVNYTNSNGCTATAATVYNVTVNALPVPALDGDIIVCDGDANVVYTTDAGMTGYAWNVTGGIIISGGTSTSNTATVTWGTSGPGTVSVSYLVETGIQSTTSTLNVIINPLPVPVIAGDNLVCTGDLGVVYTTEAGMTGYNWVVTGGAVTSGGTSTSNLVTVNWLNAGNGSISVNYNNGNGCTAVAPTVFNVTINPLPVPVITGDNAVCVGDAGVVYTTEAAMSDYVWNVTGGIITSAGTATSNTATITWNTAGAGNISVGYTNANGCISVAATVYNVTVNPLPVPSIAGDNSVCIGDAGVIYTTEAGMSNYTWNVTGGQIAAGGTGTSNSVAVTWNSAAAGTVSVNYTNGNGCTAVTPSLLNVTVNPLPAATLSGDNFVCAAEAGFVYTTEAGMTGYQWNVTGGTITSGGTSTSNTATITWNTAGAQSVVVNYNNTNGCTSIPVTYNVTVTPLPLPTITGDNSVCIGDAGIVYTTETGMTGYTWNVTGGTITAGGTATSNTVTIAWNNSGVGTVSVNYTNGNLCTASTATVYNVTVNPLPVPTIAGNSMVCIDESGVIYSTEPGMTNYLWSVSGGSITSGGTSSSNSVTITWNTLGAGTVSVGYTNANGCISSLPTVYNVTINNLPVPTITGDILVCQGESGISYTTEAGMTNYTWNITGGTISAGGTSTSNFATVTWTTPGTGIITVNYTNPNGCNAVSPTEYNVVVNPLPVPVITGDNAVCNGETGVVYSTESGMTGYTWNITGGIITAGGNLTSNTATVSWTTAGTGSISVNYNNLNGCSASQSITYSVIVNPLPGPVINGYNSVCIGDAGIVYTTEDGMTNYVWNVTGGIITSGGNATSNTATITWNTAGDGTVSVGYTNGNGCTSLSATVYNISVNSLPVPNLNGDNNVCQNEIVTYTTEAGMNNYIWSVNGGIIMSGGTATSNTVNVAWSTSGAGSVSASYSNSNGCTAGSPTIINVTVNSLPVPTLSGDNAVCIGESGVIYTTEPGMTGYNWNVMGGTITAGGTSTSNTATITWNTAGLQSVSVNYSNINGCTATTPTDLSVTVNPLPVPVITGDNTVCEASAGDIFTTEAGMTGYIWTVSGSGTIISGGTPTDNSVTVSWSTAGSESVSVIYTNANGCSATTATVYPVTVNPLPVPVLTGNTNSCTTYPEIYTTAPNMQSYVWSVTGGTIVSGGTSTSSTVTIQWNEQGTGIVSIGYSNANGCSSASPTALEVTVTTSPEAAGIISGETIVCENQTVTTYTVSPITNATGYIWNLPEGAEITSGTNTNTITLAYLLGSESGELTVYGTNGYCSGGLSEPLYITVDPQPKTPEITYQNGILTSDQSEGNQWYLNGNIIEGANATSYEPLENGNYNVIITQNGCSSVQSNTINVTDVSVKEMISSGLKLYPNPTLGRLQLSFETYSSQNILMQVFDHTGAIVWSRQYLDSANELRELINLDQQKPGIYLLKLTIDGFEISRKIILTR